MNCVYIEQNLRYCGYFGVYFKKWRKASGAEFDYLAMNKSIEICKQSKERSKDIQVQKRLEAISRIVHAPILTHHQYENEKTESSDEVKRYKYCLFNNSNMVFRPFWTYVNEKKNKNSVVLYFYSTNMMPLLH